MACTATIAGRALPCKDALGGIKKVWVAPFSVDMWDVVASGAIADAAAALTLKDFDMLKNTGSFTQSVNASIENGTIFYTQVVSCVFSKIVAADIGDFEAMIKGRLAIVVQDVNDNYFVMGHIRGCEVSGGSIESGTALGDMNGLKYEFTAEEVIAAPFLTIAGANLTFTTT